MDMPLDSERRRAAARDLTPDPVFAPGPPLPRWMHALGAAAVLLSLAALSVLALLFTAILQGNVAQPAALSLGGIALVCGVAAGVASVRKRAHTPKCGVLPRRFTKNHKFSFIDKTRPGYKSNRAIRDFSLAIHCKLPYYVSEYDYI